MTYSDHVCWVPFFLGCFLTGACTGGEESDGDPSGGAAATAGSANGAGSGGVSGSSTGGASGSSGATNGGGPTGGAGGASGGTPPVGGAAGSGGVAGSSGGGRGGSGGSGGNAGGPSGGSAGSGKGGSAGGGSVDGLVEACYAVCQGRFDGQCGVFDVLSCQGTCDSFLMEPLSCQVAAKAYWDCVLEQPTVCGATAACDAQGDAMNAAC